MFTVLSIERWEQKGFLKIFGLFFKNSIKHYSADTGSFKINYIDFLARNGRINWKKIGRKINKIGAPVVYSGREEIPEFCSFSSFVPVELRSRLCSNMSLEVLDIMKSDRVNLRVGFYDPAGDYADFIPYLLKFTDNPVVVTKNMELYSALSQELIFDTGAVLRPVRNLSALSNCGLIIAPSVIKEKFTPMSKAVVLTSLKPKVYLPCSVYYKYSFRLPKALENFRPQDTDTEAFGGALYSLCNVFSVGSLVPFVCANDTLSQTTLSLKKYFIEQFST